MKKSKLITVLLFAVVLIMALCSVFVACDPDDSGDKVQSGDHTQSGDQLPSGGNNKPKPPKPTPNPGEEEPIEQYTQMEVLNKIVESVGDTVAEQAINFDIGFEATTPEGVTTMSLKTNIYSDRLELALTAYRQLKNSKDKEFLFGLYMMNGKVYISTGEDKALLYLEDFDMDYLYPLLQTVPEKWPEWKDQLDGLLAGLLPGFTVDSILELVVGMIFQNDPIITKAEDGSTDIAMQVMPKEFLDQLAGLIGIIQLPVQLPPIFNYLTRLIPDVQIFLNSSFDEDGAITDLNLSVEDNKSSTSSNNCVVTVNVDTSATATDIGLPDITDTNVSKFSFTNIMFSIDLTLGTIKDETGNYAQLDVGQIVNSFLSGSQKLPENVLMVEGGTGLRLQFSLDLDLNYAMSEVDNNKIAIELFLINQYGQLADPLPQMGLYYSEGSFYLNLDRLLPSYMKGINLQVEASLADLVKGLVTMIKDAIDGVFFGGEQEKAGVSQTSFRVNDNASLTTASRDTVMSILQTAGVDVLAVSTNADTGEWTLAPEVHGLVAAIGAVLGVEDFVQVVGNSIQVRVNNDFLKALSGLIGGLDFKFPPQIGDIVLSINTSEIGLESVKVNATLDKINYDEDGELDGKVPTAEVELKIHDFLIGYEDPNMDTKIARIDKTNVSYLNKLSSVVDTVLGGITLSSNFNLKFSEGTYDLAPFIAGFGVKEVEKLELLWKFNKDFVLDASLNLQIALNRQDPSKSLIVLEIKTEEGITVGNSEIIPGNTTLIGIYGYNNNIYIDLSNFKIANITLPKLSFQLNFSQLVFNILDDTIDKMLQQMNITGGDFEFKFDLADLIFGKGESNVPAAGENSGEIALANQTSKDNATAEEIKALVLSVNTDRINLTLSMGAILAILSTMNTDIGKTLSNALSLMEVDLIVNMGRTDEVGFTFDFDANIIPKLDSENNAVYYYDKDGKRLPSRDANGNKIYYSEKEYERKEYYYGDVPLKLHFEAGTKNYPIKVGDITGYRYDIESKVESFKTYKSDLIQAIMDTVGKGEVVIDIDLQTMANQMDLTSMINNVLANMGKQIDLPLRLNLDDWNANVQLVVRWNLDLKNTIRSAIELALEYEGKKIFGIYIYRGSIIIDLEGLGLISAEVTNLNVVSKLFGMINDMIKQIGDFDLSKIINDFLKNQNLPTVPGAPEGGDVATGGDVPTVGEDFEALDLVQYILQAVSLEDTKICVNFSAALISTVLNELLGMNLGIDFNLDAELDLFKGNSFSIDLGVEDLSFDITLQLDVGGDIDIFVDYDSIPDWNAIDGRTLATTMLDNLNVGFKLDFVNYTSDTIALEKETSGSTDNNVAYTRVLIEKVGPEGKMLTNLKNNVRIDEGAFVITVAHLDRDRFDNTDKGRLTPLVYVVLDYKKTSGQMQIKLCKNVIKALGFVDLGDFVDISTNMDLIGQLAPVFDNLLKTLDGVFDKKSDEADNSGTPAVHAGENDSDTPSEPTGFDKIFAELDIMKLLGDGIDINLRSNGNFNVEISFDPYLINKLIDDVLSMVFGPDSILDLASMAPQMFSQNYLANVNWTREITGGSSNSFWSTLRSQLTPLLNDVLYSLAGIRPVTDTVAFTDIYKQIRKIICGLLPFAVFNEFKVGLNVVNANIANLYVTGYDHGQDIKGEQEGDKTYDSKAQARGNGYYTEIWLYNVGDHVGDPGGSFTEEGIVTWDDIPTQIDFAPYTYASVDDGEKALKEAYFGTDKIARYQRKQDIFKTKVTFQIIKERGVVCAKSIDDLDLSQPGEYIVRATANFGTHKNVELIRTLDIKINAKGLAGGIESIEPIEMHVYDRLPDFITLHLKDDPEPRKVNTKYLRFENMEPQKYTAHSITARVIFPNSAYNQDVTVNYLDSTINQIVVDGVEGNVVNVNLYEYNTEKTKIEDYIADRIYFKYKDGKAIGMDVNEAWDTSAASMLFDRELNVDGKYSDDVSGGEFTVTNYIGTGAARQQVVLKFVIKTKKITKLTINGMENTLRIDPYRYYLYEITPETALNEKGESLKESYNPFPKVATAEYYEEYVGADGKTVVDTYEEEVHIKWGDYSGIKFDWANENNGSTPIKVYLDNGYEEYTGSFTWKFDTNAVVMRNQIEGLYFDKDLTQTTLFIDPFDFKIKEEKGEATYPETAWVQFTNGKLYEMPIAWTGTEKIDIDYASQFAQLNVHIGFDPSVYVSGDANSIKELVNINGTLLQDVVVNVKVKNVKPVGIELAGSEMLEGTTYYIDPIQTNYYGMPAFPSQVKVKYDNGDYAVLDVTWEKNFNITMTGRKGLKAWAVITESYKYPINVEIIDRTALQSTVTHIDIDPFVYTTDEKGGRIYDAYSEYIELYQKVGDLNLETFEIENRVLTTAPVSDDEKYQSRLTYVLKYTLQDGIEQSFTANTVDTLRDFIDKTENLTAVSVDVVEYYPVNVSWDLTDVNYSIPDEYEVKAIIRRGTEYQKAYKVGVTVIEKHVTGLANDYIQISYGGTSLSEEQRETKKIVTKMNVYFTDKDGKTSYGQYEVTIDLSTIDFNTYTLLQESGSDGGVVCKDKNGNVIESTDESIHAQAYTVKATVCSGEIAQETTVKVNVVLNNMSAN